MAIDPAQDQADPIVSARALGRIGIAFMVVVSLLDLAYPLAHLPFQVPRSPNEGWNAIHAMQAMGGGALYPPSDGFMFNNYPPLSFYIVGLLGRLTGDDIMAGRILSIAAVFAIGANVALTVRNLGGTTLF